VIKWHVQLTSNVLKFFTEDQRTLLYDTFPVLTRSFVTGAPGLLCNNYSPELGVSNGSDVFYHSLTLGQHYQTVPKAKDRIIERIRIAAAGEEIWLEQPPYSINVMIPCSNPVMWPKNALAGIDCRDSTNTQRVVLPICQHNFKGDENQFRLRPGSGNVHHFVDYHVQPGFCITFHKSQGRTLSRVILDLSNRRIKKKGRGGRMNPTYESILVGLSRVRHRSHVKLLGMRPSSGGRKIPLDLAYCSKLKPDKNIAEWMATNYFTKGSAQPRQQRTESFPMNKAHSVYLAKRGK
jgi:hypothetical protein